MNKFGEWKNMNLGFSSKVEEKALIQDKVIVFQDFGTWCLISGQSWKIWDGGIYARLLNSAIKCVRDSVRFTAPRV